MFTRLHYEIILPVAEKRLSVDDGFVKLAKIVYGQECYLWLSREEKLTFLLEMAYLSYTFDSNETSAESLENIYSSSFLNPNNFPN
jgi:hypothetical protein